MIRYGVAYLRHVDAVTRYAYGAFCYACAVIFITSRRFIFDAFRCRIFAYCRRCCFRRCLPLFRAHAFMLPLIFAAAYFFFCCRFSFAVTPCYADVCRFERR